MVRAFSRNSIKFDHDPTNAELTVLLGDHDHPGRILVEETTSLLIARPGLIPIKFVAPWVVFTALTITVLLVVVVPRFGGNTPDALALSMLVVLWVLIVPTSIAFIVWLNRYFSRKGDYFKVDKQQRTLDLIQLGRKFDASEIKSFTELCRSYKRRGEWFWTWQLGVVVSCVPGEWEVLPLVRDISYQHEYFTANKLGTIFGVPVRRQSIDWRECRTFRDGVQ